MHEALERLESTDAQRAELVKLRFFGGLGMQQIAEVLNISVPTAKRRWRYCRAWLSREIAGKDGT